MLHKALIMLLCKTSYACNFKRIIVSFCHAITKRNNSLPLKAVVFSLRFYLPIFLSYLKLPFPEKCFRSYRKCTDKSSSSITMMFRPSVFVRFHFAFSFSDKSQFYDGSRKLNHSAHIRTRLKRPINGAFRLVVAHRRQPYMVLRTENPSLLRSFQVVEFCR